MHLSCFWRHKWAQVEETPLRGLLQTQTEIGKNYLACNPLRKDYLYYLFRSD